MISLPSNVLTLLDQGRIAIAGMVLFQFGTGTYGFIKAPEPLTYNGVTYVPGGIIQVSEIVAATGLTAQQFEISLSSSGFDPLTPEVLQTIEAEDYRDRPVTIFDAYIHPDTGELLHVQAMKRGYVDTIDHEETTSLGYTLTASCETRALDYTRTNGRQRSVADQQRRLVGDKFFEHAALRGRQEFYWGQTKSAEQSTSSIVSYILKGNY